jgi:hypothetical protein
VFELHKTKPELLLYILPRLVIKKGHTCIHLSKVGHIAVEVNSSILFFFNSLSSRYLA